MANFNRTLLTSDNKAVIEHILKHSERSNAAPRIPYFKGHQLNAAWDKEGNTIKLTRMEPDYIEKYAWKHIYQLSIVSKNETFEREAVAISKQFPKSKLYCESAGEADDYFRVTKAEYLNGQVKVIGYDYCPVMEDDMNVLRGEMGEERHNEAVKRVMKFVNSLYGNMMIAPDETITYSFVMDDYKIEATIPFGPRYYTNVLKARRKTETEWVAITDELPF